MEEIAPGSELGGFRLESVLGRGGMGIVYLATDIRLQRRVAIKLIADARAADHAFRERFEREARVMAAIDHPNVIPVYAAGEADGHLYLAMRYVPGTTDLQELLRREGALQPERAAEIVRQVALALDAAHRSGLVHRDVKPANVLLSGSDVYLTDFGLTRPIDADTHLTDTGERLGTVDFMSPEQLRGGRTDARSDVYALGCVLFTILTGAPPFHRSSPAATITAHLEDQVPRVSQTGAPVELDAVIARALAKDPAGRYPSAGDLGRAAVDASRGREPDTASHSVARGEAAPLEDTRALPHHDELPTRHVEVPSEGATVAIRTARPRRQRFVERLVVGAFAAIALAVGVLALAGRSNPNRPLSDGEVGALAQAFAQAYGREDARALSSLLTADVQRVTPGAVQHGRQAVIAQYRNQFRANRTTGYRLDGLDARGGSVGRAAARFTVTRQGRPPITGNVVLGIERRAGRPQIRLIATEPRA